MVDTINGLQVLNFDGRLLSQPEFRAMRPEGEGVIHTLCWSPESDHILFPSGKHLVIRPLQPSSKQTMWKVHAQHAAHGAHPLPMATATQPAVPPAREPALVSHPSLPSLLSLPSLSRSHLPLPRRPIATERRRTTLRSSRRIGTSSTT